METKIEFYDEKGHIISTRNNMTIHFLPRQSESIFIENIEGILIEFTVSKIIHVVYALRHTIEIYVS